MGKARATGARPKAPGAPAGARGGRARPNPNPFEVKVNRQKFQVLGRKTRHDVGLPGVSRARAIQKVRAVALGCRQGWRLAPRVHSGARRACRGPPPRRGPRDFPPSPRSSTDRSRPAVPAPHAGWPAAALGTLALSLCLSFPVCKHPGQLGGSNVYIDRPWDGAGRSWTCPVPLSSTLDRVSLGASACAGPADLPLDTAPPSDPAPARPLFQLPLCWPLPVQTALCVWGPGTLSFTGQGATQGAQ